MEYDELYHYGIKGMKWGIRRTAEQLGHVVKKSAKKVKTSFEEAREKRRQQANSTSARDAKVRSNPKSVKDMSDSELRELYNRLQLERNVLDMQRQVNSFMPKEVSRGQKIMNSIKKTGGRVFNNTILPTVEQLGKSYLTELGKKTLGLDKADPTKVLKEEVDELRLKANKMKYEDQISESQRKRDERAKGNSSSSSKSSSNSNESSKASKPKESSSESKKETSSTRKESVSSFTSDDVSRGRDYVDRLGLMDRSIAGFLPPAEEEKRKRS